MLVHPVGPEAGADAVTPPRLLVDLATPRPRGVPVVADVVVVEDHRRRQGGQDPADLRVSPGVPVKALVFAEGDHLIRWAAAGLAMACQVAARVGGEFVGVYL